jgi:hypothetical protein
MVYISNYSLQSVPMRYPINRLANFAFIWGNSWRGVTTKTQ